jgi:gliding motility-associated-like protein
MRRWRTLWFLLLTLGMCTTSWARHIVGGDFVMTALPTQGRYSLTLNLYNDNIEADPNTYEASITVYIFRKSDNFRMTPNGIAMTRRSISNVVYENAKCAENRQLATSEIRYTAEISLDPTRYNDPQGYYIIWERCCRNNVITNIQNPGGTGIVFVLEFPAIVQNMVEFKNSSPDFKFPNGDYICANRPFSFDMGATDADGDELRYSLVTPLAGYSSIATPAPMGGPSRSSYPEVRWATGIGLANFIPGPRRPSINNRGILTLTANQPGLYVFAVLVEEYRNGVKIGAVRREFQLPVVDCGRAVPPPPSIFENDTVTAIRSVSFCEGSFTEISTRTDPTLSYQWKKDGANLPGEQSAKLRVNQPGDYQVVVSLTRTCSVDTASYVVKVTAARGPAIRLTPTDTLKFCSGDTAILRSTDNNLYRYEWFKDGTLLAGQNRSSLSLTQAGSYVVRIRDTRQNPACPSLDTVQSVMIAKPVAPLTASRDNFCPGDSVLLQTDWPASQTGIWLKEGLPLLAINKTIAVKQAGSYQVRIVNGQCSTTSTPVTIRQNQAVTIQFDSLAAICIDEQPLVALTASPPDGTFSGKGVENSIVNVKTAGLGLHAITYKSTNTDGCSASQTRYLRVEPSPVLRLRPSSTVIRGGRIMLEPKPDSLVATTYEWSPATGLDNPTLRNPTATVTQDITYTLLVTSANGCKAQAFTNILVADYLYIPDAFSPNDDGINETWELRKTDQHPDFEVYIYNRWGELVFYAKEGQKNFWDGTYQGIKVASGLYTYLIKSTGSDQKVSNRTGAVWVLR